ncbi:hypothetical protein [Thaumasiovibrio sp. DFM-14]|uniref:hypothetical protein n=1 Tax=Thaumasiovibrio sp. DFM-14 TaxID=3384792 RepID=UPI0039A1D22F
MKRVLPLLWIGCYAFSASAQSGSEFSLPTIYVGVAASSGELELSNPDFNGKRKFEGDSNIMLQLGLKQQPHFFGESAWGYHTQLIATTLKNDVSSSTGGSYSGDVKGVSVVAEPVLFYQWGSRQSCHGCKSIRAQAGIGAEYVNLHGKVAEDGDTYRFNFDGVGMAGHFALVGSYGFWDVALRLSSASRIRDGDTKLRLGMSHLMLGYRF